MTGHAGEENVAGRVNLKLLTQHVLLYFSAITGISFAASAIVYELVFATWGLDFTAIGTPSDVVMGGFRIITIFVLVFLIISGFTTILSAFLNTKGQFNNKNWRRLVTAVIFFLILGSFSLFSFSTAERTWHWMLSMGPYRVLALVAVLAVLAMGSFVIKFLGIPIRIVIQGLKSHWQAEFVMSLVGSVLVLFATLSYTSYLVFRSQIGRPRADRCLRP